MRKIRIILLCLLLIVLNHTSYTALDLPYKGHENEWRNFCLKDELNDQEEESCKKFMIHISNQSGKLEDEIDKINKELEDVQHSIEEQVIIIGKYQEQIKGFQEKIDELSVIIDDRTAKIVVKEAEIKVKEEKIAELNKKIRARMLVLQKTIHFNNSFDFLLGATSFDDLIIRANGLAVMERYDEELKNSLRDLLDQLNIDKEELENERAILQDDKDILEKSKKAVKDLLLKEESIKNEYMILKADLEEKGNQLAANIDLLQSTLKELSSAISNVVTSNGFTRPVSGGSITAGTWAYSSGGVHLGLDFANDAGTPLRAVGNGVIVYSTDGCGYGYLGNTCAGKPMGSAGGGNQIYLIASINGSIYGLRYLHLQSGTGAKAGTIVTAGETIGLMGSSGNSSGPHLHFEIVYLGKGNLYSYVEDWMEDGSLSFGAGFGYKALNRLCENGVGAPCRVRPEKYFN